MMFFDTNAWIGEWPFQNLPVRDVAALRRHWRRHGIGGGLVSSFSALWPVDPMPGNRALRAAISGARGVSALPVLNLCGPGWERDLDEIESWPEVRAVRLAPAYGGWSLRSRAAQEAAAAITAHGRRVVLTVRLVDERHEHPALRIKPVKVADIVRWAKAVPGMTPLLRGLSRWEMEKLAEAAVPFRADLSHAEWTDTLGTLGRTVPFEHLLFGSLAPLHITAAQVAKIAASPQTEKRRLAVAVNNAKIFLKIDQ